MSTALESVITTPTPAPSQAPAAPAPEPAPVSTTSHEPAEYKEIQGGPVKPAEPAKPAEANGKYKTLEDANKGYDELYKMWTEGAGKTKNAVEKLEQLMGNMPTQLGQIIAQNLAQVLQQTQPKAEPAKPKEPESAQNTLFQFTADDLVDPGLLGQNLTKQFLALQAKQQPQELNPDKLLEAAAPKFAEMVEKAIVQREQATLKARAESDMKDLIDAGNDPALVKAAVMYGVENGKNSVGESWKAFQAKYPVLFANQKAEDIIGAAASERANVPRELGNGVNVIDENGLRSAFKKVVGHKFVSDGIF